MAQKEGTVKKVIKMSKIQDLFHKYCSGSIDEKGHCNISNNNYKKLEDEILLLIENELKNCGGWNLSVVEAISNLKIAGTSSESFKSLALI